MRVFLSWSGQYSRQHAECFKSWLPCVLQDTTVYMSSHSIEAGERWSDSINRALNDTDFGILFVTEQNKEASWLHYEAGALAKNVSKSRVIPILIDLEVVDIQRTPLIHFQSVKANEDGVRNIVDSLYSCIENPDLESEYLRKCLDKWWPDLEECFSNLKKPKVVASKGAAKKELNQDGELVEESLSTLLSMITSLQNEVRGLRMDTRSIRNDAMHTSRNVDYFSQIIEKCIEASSISESRDAYRYYHRMRRRVNPRKRKELDVVVQSMTPKSVIESYEND